MTKQNNKKPINKEILLRVLSGFAGFGCVSVGVGWIYWPAGLIIFGLLLIVEAWRR